jgi:hypothetical protein
MYQTEKTSTRKIGITMTDINAITTQFENKTLPKEQWTHLAHFAVAFVYLEKYQTIHETLPQIRESIKSYNVSVGTANTESSGYHETLTIFWLTVVYEFYALKNHSDINAAYSQFIKTGFMKPDFPLNFYTKELLFSTVARESWVEPNLLKLFTLKEMYSNKKTW